MPSTTKSIINFGSENLVIEAECHLSNSLPGIVIVGLGGKAVDEAKHRIRSAFASCGIIMPRKKITINLAPADIPKDSTSLDLAIAVSILNAGGQLKHKPNSSSAIIGELGLSGEVRPVRGIIGKVVAGKRLGIMEFYIPLANLDQAMLVPNIKLIGIKNLTDLFAIMTGQKTETILSTKDGTSLARGPGPSKGPGLYEVVGQERAKRALEIAAAGGHNLLLSGPPGMGKSMLARTMPSILPELNREEMLEITHIHSLSRGSYEQIVTARPFRAPHHSASYVSIIGGGASLRPGEVSLAHRGVLFLDELPEFKRDTIEALRQPLEDKIITISRAKDSADYPANFMLVATANPCPCGNYGTQKICECAPHKILNYRQKLSGPIIDRIDICVDVSEVDHSRLLSVNKDPNDNSVRQRILSARAIQQHRYKSNTRLNADSTNSEIRSSLGLIAESKSLIDQAAAKLNFSARTYMRLIKIARTIADLEGSATIQASHVGEAIQYRPQASKTLM